MFVPLQPNTPDEARKRYDRTVFDYQCATIAVNGTYVPPGGCDVGR